MSTIHLIPPDSRSATTSLPSTSPLPDAVDADSLTIRTSIGTLAFLNDVPTKETIRRLYDNLDLIHGVDAFLKSLRGVSLYRLLEAQRRLTGPGAETLRIFFRPVSSKLSLVVPKISRYEAWSFIDLERDGPMIIDFPPAMLGVVDDMWSRSVADLGLTGADAGRGGKYLLLPPHYKGPIPLGYTVLRPRTNGVWLFARCLSARRPNNLLKVLAEEFKVYSLVGTGSARPIELVNGSQLDIGEIALNDYGFYEDLDRLVQMEPSSSFDKDRRSLFASIDIVKGKPFHPNLRMKRILIDAAAIAGATVRAINQYPRDVGRSFDISMPSAAG